MPAARQTSGLRNFGSGLELETSARPEISMSAGAPQHSPYTSWNGKLLEGPLYVCVVTAKLVGPGVLITLTPSIINVRPSSWPALNVSPLVTVTVPVKLKIVLSRASAAWLAPEVMIAPPEERNPPIV